MDLETKIMAEAKTLIASLMGGLIWLYFRPEKTFMRSAWALACCVACGYYFTPIVMHYGGLSPDFIGGVGAFLGAVGLSVAKALVQYDYADIVGGFISKFGSKK